MKDLGWPRFEHQPAAKRWAFPHSGSRRREAREHPVQKRCRSSLRCAGFWLGWWRWPCSDQRDGQSWIFNEQTNHFNWNCAMTLLQLQKLQAKYFIDFAKNATDAVVMTSELVPDWAWQNDRCFDTSRTGYGACDVAYLLWDQIATNVVEERVVTKVYKGINQYLLVSWFVQPQIHQVDCETVSFRCFTCKGIIDSKHVIVSENVLYLSGELENWRRHVRVSCCSRAKL